MGQGNAEAHAMGNDMKDKFLLHNSLTCPMCGSKVTRVSTDNRINARPWERRPSRPPPARPVITATCLAGCIIRIERNSPIPMSPVGWPKADKKKRGGKLKPPPKRKVIKPLAEPKSAWIKR